MTAPPPMEFVWEGASLRPLRPAFAERFYVAGEIYRMEPREERSSVSHNHYFAALQEAFDNMPESMAEQFPTVEHLRKFALIKGGFCDTQDYTCGSNEEATRLAAFIRPIDTYAVVEARGDVVRVHRAQSQSVRAMDKQTFQRSKTTVLEIVSQLVGVSPSELQANTAHA